MSKGPQPARIRAASSVPGSATIDAWQLAAAAGGLMERVGSGLSHGGAVDSRRVAAGNIFFALAGEHTDGHRFLAEAAAAGASSLIVSEVLPAAQLDVLTGPAGAVTIVRVRDTAVALRAVAATYRDRFEPLLIGVTGSIAKTSTKEQIAAVLDERHTVLRNRGNENNEIGLPLTLLRLDDQHDAAVLEMGLYTTGEIALLAQMARPSIGVVTAVRGVHLSRAGSIEAIEAGKRELVEALPADGWAVLNVDDARVAAMAAHTHAQVRGYGFSEVADVRAVKVQSLGTAGMRFELQVAGDSQQVTSPMLGRHGVHNALAAAAVAHCAGMTTDDIVHALGREVIVPHRSQLIRAGEWTILDDSYNASPDAVLAALSLLATLPGRRIAVLGEMLELGDVAASEHRRVGLAAASLVDRLVVVGAGVGGIADGAFEGGLKAKAIERVSDKETALAYLIAELRAGDSVLVKASRGAALDVLVERLVLAARAGEASA